jgi:drug/metabolite transporter (DMT)-like permease
VTRRGLLLFGAMCVIWGIPYLFIKIAIRDLSPATLVFARTTIAALLLLPLAGLRGDLRPLLVRWLPVLIFAGVEIALPWWLLAKAEETLSSSLTALLIAAVPLIGAVLARTTGKRERFGGRALAGFGLGMAGVAALVGFNTAGSSPVAIAEVGLVALCYAVGPAILDRHLSDLPSIGVIAASLGVCALAYAPIAATELPSAPPSAEVISAVIVLAVVCTALAFILFFELIAEVGPVRATVITYVNPAVAAVAGVAFLGETFTAGMGAGFALIIVGSFLATHQRREPGSTSVDESGHELLAGPRGRPGDDPANVRL